MLKKCYGLFLGLMVIAGSACVTPTHASSASIVITTIRAGTQASTGEEAVVVYNNSSFEADITGWCLSNKAVIKFACFTPHSQNEVVILPAYSYAVAVSVKAAKEPSLSLYSVVYEPDSSSGSIVASSDTITLIDSAQQAVDQFSWSSSVSSSQQWSRTKLSALPDLFVDTNNSIDWQKISQSELPVSQVVYREGSGETAPEENEEEPTDNQGTIPSPMPAVITELLPNPAGSDTGNEFIEIYNPNEAVDISLKGYQLRVGPSLDKLIVLSDYILKPGEYKVFTNKDLPYSLLNSSSRVSLATKEGKVSEEVVSYSLPPDSEAWALIDDTWQYTNQPTPGSLNLLSAITDDSEAMVATTAQKPCAANQYRSAETGRCRLNSSSTPSSPAACKVGQIRNVETNRCRNIPATVTTGCKEGQEKNPETNRCRTVKKLSSANYGVKGAASQQQSGMGWYIWAAIGGIVLLILGYGVWEWREELKKLLETVQAKFAGRLN